MLGYLLFGIIIGILIGGLMTEADIKRRNKK